MKTSIGCSCRWQASSKELATAIPRVMLSGMDSTRSSLLIRLRDKTDNDSWSEFFAVYEPFLTGIARRLGLKDHQASDVVADVLTICVQKLPEFEYDRDHGRFRGWLKTITQRVVFDQWRRTSRQADQVPITAGVEPTTNDDVWEAWDQAHREHVLKAALSAERDKTQPRTWSCFKLHILQRVPAAQVAEQLGLQINAVYTNASRVLDRVRARCAEFDEELSCA